MGCIQERFKRQQTMNRKSSCWDGFCQDTVTVHPVNDYATAAVMAALDQQQHFDFGCEWDEFLVR
jgi:hypothetical protein